MKDLDKVLNFLDLIHQFRSVERGVLVKSGSRNENDSEHSYSLAMLGWYINNSFNLKLNNERILKYALAHDLVEAYAGDVHFYKQDESTTLKKHESEVAAAEKLKSVYPEFEDMHTTICDYENRVDRESRFIYALDKIEPVMNIYLDGGRTWRRDGITLEMLITMKSPKVAQDPFVKGLFSSLTASLEEEHDSLFK